MIEIIQFLFVYNVLGILYFGETTLTRIDVTNESFEVRYDSTIVHITGRDIKFEEIFPIDSTKIWEVVPGRYTYRVYYHRKERGKISPMCTQFNLVSEGETMTAVEARSIKVKSEYSNPVIFYYLIE